jgi:hypothetical protein
MIKRENLYFSHLREKEELMNSHLFHLILKQSRLAGDRSPRARAPVDA